ncbi:hypothetical protein Ancab_004261 [Ancistrocladus abbreviatus]
MHTDTFDREITDSKFRSTQYIINRAITDYLSRDLPYKLSSDIVFVTSGCTNAIDIALSTLADPGANILLPRPGFPIYELCAAFRNVEERHFDLLPEKGWEINLEAVEALDYQNTAAIVVINPGNPCGNVYNYQNVKKSTARNPGIVVVADKVYGHLAFGSNPSMPMGVFGSIVPVLTLGSLSKGLFLARDLIIERLKKYFDIYGGPATFIQAAMPCILEETDKVFFRKTINTLKQTSDMFFDAIKEFPCLTCSHKAEGSMAVMVELVVILLGEKIIYQDQSWSHPVQKPNVLQILKDFLYWLPYGRLSPKLNCKVASCRCTSAIAPVLTEHGIALVGVTVRSKNWLMITFAIEPASLEEALRRVKSFYLRHANQQPKYLTLDAD